MCINLAQQKLKIDNVNSSKLHYQLILKKYFNYLISKKLTEHTILVSKSEIKKFLEYLIKVNVKRLSKITNENIFNYIPKNIFPHMFRHSKAMHLLESGVNYVYIRDFLGHSNIKTTEIYARISIEQKKKVLDSVYSENVPINEICSWNKDKDLLTYLMEL